MSNEELKQLEHEWYSKLLQDGFMDIENTNHPERPLQTWHNLKFRDVSQDEMDAKLKYYSKAKDLLNTYPFENEIHQKIWELHSDGITARKIEKLINSTYKRASISSIIKLIAAEII
jgi:hypothetical protein